MDNEYQIIRGTYSFKPWWVIASYLKNGLEIYAIKMKNPSYLFSTLQHLFYWATIFLNIWKWKFEDNLYRSYLIYSV